MSYVARVIGPGLLMLPVLFGAAVFGALVLSSESEDAFAGTRSDQREFKASQRAYQLFRELSRPYQQLVGSPATGYSSHYIWSNPVKLSVVNRAASQASREYGVEVIGFMEGSEVRFMAQQRGKAPNLGQHRGRSARASRKTKELYGAEMEEISLFGALDDFL